MVKQNDVINIAGEEFLVNKDAKEILEKYQSELSKKYRFNAKVLKELSSALRDVLSEKTVKSKTITVSTAKDTILMIGDSYEKEGRLSPLVQKCSIFLNKIKGAVLTEKFRKRIYLTLMFIMLLPLGMSISGLRVFQPNSETVNTDQNSSTTTLGIVTLGNYINSQPLQPESFFPESNTLEYSVIVVTVLLTVLFFLLSRRSKHVKIVVALLVVSVVSSLNINDNYQRSLMYAANNSVYAFINQPVSTYRAVDDFDRLQACGAQINIVLSDNSSGMFYKLRDTGFKLKTELGTPGSDLDPTRDQICVAYNELRKLLPDSSIVLQYFIKDEKGEIRPYDFQEQMSRAENNKRQNKTFYGFFVKE